MSHRGELTDRIFRLTLLLAERPHSQKELARVFAERTFQDSQRTVERTPRTAQHAETTTI